MADVNVEETNALIENVLGELISKEILYEPFICLKDKVMSKTYAIITTQFYIDEKIEKEIEKGNSAHEKGLSQINEILYLMDDCDKSTKNKDKLMQLIYEVYFKENTKFLNVLLASRARRSLGFTD